MGSREARRGDNQYYSKQTAASIQVQVQYRVPVLYSIFYWILFYILFYLISYYILVLSIILFYMYYSIPMLVSVNTAWSAAVAACITAGIITVSRGLHLSCPMFMSIQQSPGAYKQGSIGQWQTPWRSVRCSTARICTLTLSSGLNDHYILSPHYWHLNLAIK